MSRKLVMLRPPLDEDSPLYFKWINDRELVLSNGHFRPISQPEHNEWFKNNKQQDNTHAFSILTNPAHQLIGSCSLRNINQTHRNAEFQIRIGERNFQNRGYGSDAIQLTVQYAFNELNLIRVYLYVLCTNIKAINAYKKCGFEIEGHLKQAAFIDGKYVDLYIMAIIKQ